MCFIYFKIERGRLRAYSSSLRSSAGMTTDRLLCGVARCMFTACSREGVGGVHITLNCTSAEKVAGYS